MLANEWKIGEMARWFDIDFKTKDRTFRVKLKRHGSDDFLLKVAWDFPFTISMRTKDRKRIQCIEYVHVGDQVVLRSDWQNEQYKPVAIEVFNLDGDSLGYLADYGAQSYNTEAARNFFRRFIDFSGGDCDLISNEYYKVESAYEKAANRCLASLLPYTRATVVSVTPLSERNRSARYALMDIHIELASEVCSAEKDELKPDVLKSINRLKRTRQADRVTVSEHPNDWVAKRSETLDA